MVRLAGEVLDACRLRVQQQSCGHRGRAGNPLYSARRTLHTGGDLLTDKQRRRLENLFSTDTHIEVGASWAPTSAWLPPTRNETQSRERS